MAKFDGIVGKALLTVEEKENELTLVFAKAQYCPFNTPLQGLGGPFLPRRPPFHTLAA